MLEDLQIKNGEMTPKFDPYNNIYSVKVTEDIDHLEIEYKKSEDSEVIIKGNEFLKEGDETITIELITKDETTIYTLLVNKETIKETGFTMSDTFVPIEVKKELPTYVAPIISIICFLIILFTFVLLFSKKHKHTKNQGK